jgi:hypothetical protein
LGSLGELSRYLKKYQRFTIEKVIPHRDRYILQASDSLGNGTLYSIDEKGGDEREVGISYLKVKFSPGFEIVGDRIYLADDNMISIYDFEGVLEGYAEDIPSYSPGLVNSSLAAQKEKQSYLAIKTRGEDPDDPRHLITDILIYEVAD